MHRTVRKALVFAVAMVATATIAPAAASAVTVRVNDISVIDATHAYVVGGRTDASGGFASYTSDGGATWRKVLLSRWLTGVDAESFTSASAVGPLSPATALSTSDSGATWKPTSAMIPGIGQLSMRDVARLPGGKLVAVGEHRGAAAGDLATIWTSSDSGVTWTKRYDGPVYTSPDPGEDPPSAHARFESVDFASDGLTGWAVGTEWNVTGNYLTPKQALVFKTTDGGLNWTQEAFPGLGLTAMSVSVRDGSSAWIAATNGLVFKYTGTSWVSAGNPRETGTRGTISVAAGANSNTALVAGDGGLIRRTTDGGTTWNTVALFPSLRRAFSLKMSPDGVTGFAGGEYNTLLKTTNGGASWTVLSAGFVPTLPKAVITAPVAPSRMYRTKYYSAYGYLKPRHSGYPVRVYAYRYEKVNGRYVWKVRYSFAARAYNYSTYTKYVARVRIPLAGRWRLRGYHIDSGHSATWSAYSRDVYVK